MYQFTYKNVDVYLYVSGWWSAFITDVGTVKADTRRGIRRMIDEARHA